MKEHDLTFCILRGYQKEAWGITEDISKQKRHAGNAIRYKEHVETCSEAYL